MSDQAQLDELTRRHTAFYSFEDFCQRALLNNYVPSLFETGPKAAEVTQLANAFDAWQRRWGSEIRAWRGLSARVR